MFWRRELGALWRRAQEELSYKRRIVFLAPSSAQSHPTVNAIGGFNLRPCIPTSFFWGEVIYFSFIPLRVRGCLGTINHYQFRSPDRMSVSPPILYEAVAELSGVSWLLKTERKPVIRED